MKNSIVSILVLIAVISMLIAGCAQQIEVPEEFQEVIETGVLVIDSAPSQALVYIDDEFKGQTPLTLYNFPVGTYGVLVKKDGHLNFDKTVSVKVGLTEEINAALIPLKSEVIETKPEEAQKEPSQSYQSNKISLSSFAMYHDLENKLFTKMRTEKSDLFSRKYAAYIDFAAITPAKMRILSAPLNDVKKEDCFDANKGVAQLYSGQTLCIVTVEGNYFSLSGKWDKMPEELEYVQLS